MVKARAIAILLIVSSALLGLAGAVATGLACGWDFLVHLWTPGHCPMSQTPAMVWVGAVASFGIFMKFFWAGLGAFVLWRKVRTK